MNQNNQNKIQYLKEQLLEKIPVIDKNKVEFLRLLEAFNSTNELSDLSIVII